MDKISTFLWFDGEAEEAAKFYTALFPHSSINDVTRSPLDTSGGAAQGEVITVGFTLSGRSCIA